MHFCFPAQRNTVRTSHRLLSALGILLLSAATSACIDPDADTEAVSKSADLTLAADGDPQVSELQAALDEIVGAGIPGAIAFSRLGEKTQVLTSGVRDLVSGEPLRRHDRFRVGSVTKSFTATLILKLAAEGALSLDDRVERWLPGRVPNGASITIRQLLNHSSGLYNFVRDPRVSDPYFVDHDYAYYHSADDLLGYATSHEALFAPGEGWSYSNTNYLLLGMIVESVTGHDPVREIYGRIILPLRLYRSSLPVRDPYLHGRHMHGYLIAASSDEPSDALEPPLDVTTFSPSWSRTAGGIVSTVDDVARFYAALFAGQLLPAEQMAEQQETLETEEASRYGLGIMQWQTPCGAAWGHDGDSPGYKTVAISSLDGVRQAVVAISSDAWVDPWTDTPLLRRAVIAAFCGVGQHPEMAPAGDLR